MEEMVDCLLWWAACAVMGRGRPWRSAEESEQEEQSTKQFIKREVVKWNESKEERLNEEWNSIELLLRNGIEELNAAPRQFKLPRQAKAKSNFSFLHKRRKVDYCCGVAGLLLSSCWLWAGGSSAPAASIPFFNKELHFTSSAFTSIAPAKTGQPNKLFLFY